MKKLFRALEAREIGVYVTEVVPGLGARLMLYVPKEVIINRFNESFSPLGWKKEDRYITGPSTVQAQSAYICSIAARTENGDWITREARGTCSFQEDEEKSEDLNAFKRASYMWGVGKELRLLPPQLFFPEGKFNTTCEAVAHVGSRCDDMFRVEGIKYENQEEDDCHIVSITIRNITTDNVVNWDVENGIAAIVEKPKGKKRGRKPTAASPEAPSADVVADAAMTDKMVDSVLAKAVVETAKQPVVDYKNVITDVLDAEGNRRKLGDMIYPEVIYVLANTNKPEIRNACVMYVKDCEILSKQLHTMAEHDQKLAKIVKEYQL